MAESRRTLNLPILRMESVTKRFGGITAVDQCSFDIEEKLIYGLIGPNGSGKTTIFNLITGIYGADGGEMYFQGELLNSLRMYQRARKGIGRTFQLLKVFRGMTVMNNLLVPLQPKTERADSVTERAFEVLRFVDLTRLKDERAGNLSFGQQRLLEFAMILMQDPKLILLDEPTSGVNPALVTRICNYIKELQKRGKTSIIVEHNIPVVMGLCDRIIVLNYGKKIAEGCAEEISKDQRVIDAYLGSGEVQV